MTVSKGIRDSYCNKVTSISFLAGYIVNIDASFSCLESKLIFTITCTIDIWLQIHDNPNKL